MTWRDIVDKKHGGWEEARGDGRGDGERKNLRKEKEGERSFKNKDIGSGRNERNEARAE